MKQAQNARKQRGRTAQRKGGKSNSGPGNRTENKARGNPKQLLEKYKAQARDALQSGDRVTAEYYLQFADHYQRVLNETQVNREQQTEEREDKQDQRRGKGRRGRHQKNTSDQETAETVEGDSKSGGTADGSVAGSAADTVVAETVETVNDTAASVDGADQPPEVHPELDLAVEAVVEEKPKRRAPARRRRPAKPKDEEAQPIDAAESPEGGEAA